LSSSIRANSLFGKLPGKLIVFLFKMKYIDNKILRLFLQLDFKQRQKKKKKKKKNHTKDYTDIRLRG
jgi:hypothetical protein